MTSVPLYIEDQRLLYRQRPLLAMYRSPRSAWRDMPEARDWAFWIMTFQDILQLIEGRIEDPVLRRTVGVHRDEDGGHDKWYFEDLRTLALPLGDGPDLFGETHRPARELSYRQLGRVIEARSDLERLIVLEVIEATSLSLFESTAEYVRRHGRERDLLFFSENHLNAELQHDRRTEDENVIGALLESASAAPHARMIEDCYGDFARFIDELHERHYA